MAIQMRRGAYANLDTSRLVAGEVVVATDAGKDFVGVAKSSSDFVQLATQDDLDNVMSVAGEASVSDGCFTIGRVS